MPGNTLPLGQSSAGAGVKIGMIDTGIDVNNAAFSDPLSRRCPDIRWCWQWDDFQFTNAKIIVRQELHAASSGRRRSGMPTTATAMAPAPRWPLPAATVASPYGAITGVAPKAYLGSYKVLDANGGTSDVIAKAVDDAVADGMDVLNISLGSYVGILFGTLIRGPSTWPPSRGPRRRAWWWWWPRGELRAGAPAPSRIMAALRTSSPLGAIMNDRALSNAISVKRRGSV